MIKRPSEKAFRDASKIKDYDSWERQERNTREEMTKSKEKARCGGEQRRPPLAVSVLWWSSVMMSPLRRRRRHEHKCTGRRHETARTLRTHKGCWRYHGQCRGGGDR